MITYLTTNPPTRMRTETSAVMAGAVFRMTPANWSANGTTIPMTTAPSQNGTPYDPATRCDSERAIPAEPDVETVSMNSASAASCTISANAVNRMSRESASPRWPPERLRTKRSEEHTSELQSRLHLVCRLLLEKK